VASCPLLGATQAHALKAKIDGGSYYWQADHVFYGYYDTTIFTATVVPEAKPAPGSNQIHMCGGMSNDNDSTQRDGPVTWRNVFCPCEPCCRLDFSRCKMTKEFGKWKVMKFPRLTQTGPTQTASLEEFGACLDRDTIVALRCDPDEVTIEGCLWLALINAKAFKLQEDQLHQGQHFEKDWLVAKGRRFSLVETRARDQARIYKALAEETLLNVQSMLKVKGIRFIQAVPRRSRDSTAAWYENNRFVLAGEHTRGGVPDSLVNSL